LTTGIMLWNSSPFSGGVFINLEIAASRALLHL